MWVFKQVTWNLSRGLFNSCDQCYRLPFLLGSCFRYACKQMIKKKDIVYFNRNDLPPWSCCIKYNLLLEILADVCWTCVVKAIVCVFRFFLVVANGMAVKKNNKEKEKCIIISIEMICLRIAVLIFIIDVAIELDIAKRFQ